jgi:flagellar biosynthesis GTPase FlhF
MGEDAVILGTSRRLDKMPGSSRVEIVAGKEKEQGRSGEVQPGVEKREGSGGDVARMRELDTSIVGELRQIEAGLRTIMKTLKIPEIIGGERITGTVEGDLLDAGFDLRVLQRKADNGGLDHEGSLDVAIRSLVGDLSIQVPSERISAFLGPSGSGKTTTILKMVKRVYLPEGILPKVVYFGNDGDRDVSWLRTRCKMLGVKFIKSTDIRTLEAIIENERGSRILIDTPSISSLSDRDLRFLIETSQERRDMALRLVIDSTMDPLNICAIASCVPQPSRMGLILTKLDEATRIGGAVSAALTTGIPVTFVTGGGSAGDGIFVPDEDLLCEKITESVAGMGAH